MPSASAHPAGLVEELVGAGDVLGLAPVVAGRGIDGRRGEDVAAHPAGGAVAGLHQDVTVDGQRQRPAHRRVQEEGVGIVAALIGRPFGAERGIGIGELHDQPLHQRAEGRHHLALARLFHGGEDLRLHLEVPAVVELAGLEHRPGRRHRVAAALHQNRGEGRLVRIAVPVVELVPDHVVGTELLDLEGAGTDGPEVLLGALRRPGARAVLELLLLDDRTGRADERCVGERHRHGEGNPHRMVVHRFHRRHVLKPVGGVAAAVGMHAVGGREGHVAGGERRAVRPGHALPELPGDGLEIGRDAAVVRGGNLRGQRRDHVAVLVVAGQRLENERRRVDVLGSPRQERVGDGRRLPVEHPQLAVGATFRGRRRGQRHQHCRRHMDIRSFDITLTSS